MIKMCTGAFECVEWYRYLGKIRTNQIPLLKNLGAERRHGMFAVIQCRIFCLL